MDPQREQERRTYSLCRLGFGLISCAFVLLCLSGFVSVAHILPRQLAMRLMDSTPWHVMGAAIVWTSLIGVYFLWGRWSDPSWQRRAGLLLLMSIVDLTLWILDNGDRFGLRLGDFGHGWLRQEVGQALSWAEFALTASLATNVLVHLGVLRAAETSAATRSLASFGAVLWMLHFFQSTNWHVWPLQPAPPRRLEVVLLSMGWNMIWMIVLVQVTALSIATVRQCSRVVEEMDLQDQEHDLLRLPSEAALFDASLDQVISAVKNRGRSNSRQAFTGPMHDHHDPDNPYAPPRAY